MQTRKLVANDTHLPHIHAHKGIPGWFGQLGFRYLQPSHKAPLLSERLVSLRPLQVREL